MEKPSLSYFAKTADGTFSVNVETGEISNIESFVDALLGRGETNLAEVEPESIEPGDQFLCQTGHNLAAYRCTGDSELSPFPPFGTAIPVLDEEGYKSFLIVLDHLRLFMLKKDLNDGTDTSC